MVATRLVQPLKEVALDKGEKVEAEGECGDSGHATEEEEEMHVDEPEDEVEVEREMVWGNVGKFIVLHGLALWGVTLLPSLSLASWAFLYLTAQMSGLGITAGAHRLWAHKSYKARYPLKLFLIFANSMAGQNSVHTWSRDHRLHHKGSETNADPHNATRGFVFSHIGWLCVRKHPAVKKAGKTILMSDLESDPLIMLQHNHYMKCFFLAAFVIPTLVPHLCWGESLSTAYFLAVLRYVFVLHSTWLVNSAAHLWGLKPYDKTIGPVENRLVSILAIGEGHHNYHHTFPYDYGTSEWGLSLNLTTGFINTMAKLGQAYDLRSASPATVEARARRTGDWSLTKMGIKQKIC